MSTEATMPLATAIMMDDAISLISIRPTALFNKKKSRVKHILLRKIIDLND
jgi:hypothetical protein